MREQPRATDGNRIRAVIESLSSAIGAKSVERTLAHYGADVVEFSLAPPLRDRAPNAEGLATWFATWRGPIGHEIRGLDVSVGGDVAFCTGLLHMTGTKIDGERVDLWYRATFGLREIDGHWRIVHEHESVPFYMDGSYRAAVDLRP